MRVLEMCAAPGGKSAYIAGLMHDQGEIVSIDRFEARLMIMERNMKRLGIKSIKLVETDALNYDDSGFDRVLADVPCSGTGTLCKKPDIKWKKDLLDIKRITELQYNLLEKAASLVKSGGVVVYSTCSIEPEENWEIINKFLSEHPGFKLESAADAFPAEIIDPNGCIQTFPHAHQMDGAFAAKLIKL